MGKLVLIQIDGKVLKAIKDGIRVWLYRKAHNVGFTPYYSGYGSIRTLRLRLFLFNLRHRWLSRLIRLKIRRWLASLADKFGGIENGREWEKEQMKHGPTKREVDLMVELLNQPNVDWLQTGDERRRP